MDVKIDVLLICFRLQYWCTALMCVHVLLNLPLDG